MLQKIGRYEIKEELGRGGMATVYLATDPRFQREVAIKVLPRQFTHDPRFLARFEQEARTIAALEDPAIVPVHDFGEFDDAPYLVMRYMSGGTLRQRMDGKPLPLEEISRILNRLAPALDEAHRQGIIHRDLKPDNVLFDRADRPYLADFGIARMAEATHTMTVIGTPAYMSPEQAQGKQKLDGRSDIYGLGVMLFEMLSGQQPYVAETPTGQMLMHILEPVPDVLATNPDLPPQAQVVIDKAMAKDREERYRTAVDVAEAVKYLLTVEAALESPAPVVAEIQAPDAVLEEALQDEALDVTLLDTPPEGMTAAGMPEPIVEEKISESALRPDEGEKSEKRAQRPAWVWWIGAIVVVLLLGIGIGAIFGGVNGAMPEPIDSLRETIVTLLSTLKLDSSVAAPGSLLGDRWERPQDKMQMVYVPPGTFPMGSDEGKSDETPVHYVTLDGFRIDETEVTNAKYAQCVDEGECDASSYADDSSYNRDGYPVVGVTWNDADKYCRWVGGQLPTEAQWEYAARGSGGNKYPWGEEEPGCNLVQFGDCRDGMVPAGSYSGGASWTGALNMAGNVWEWVDDWYDSEYYANSLAENPTGPRSGTSKTLRGGGWYSKPNSLRSANRDGNDLAYRDNNVGFRCVFPGR